MGTCVDNPCDLPYAPCSLHLPRSGSSPQGLCLPYGVLQANPDGTRQAVAIGLCLEATSVFGADGFPCDPLYRRPNPASTNDGGSSGDAGSQIDAGFCNLINVCTPSGVCRAACNLAGRGTSCQAGVSHCKTIGHPFVSAQDPDSGILVGSGACQ